MDLAVPYTLTPPNLSPLVLNATGVQLKGGSIDGYYLTNIRGLDGQAPLRTPDDPAAQTHGAILHTRKKGGRLPTFEGIYVVESTHTQTGIATAWNTLEAALKAVLDDCLDATDPATLSWQARGLSAQSIEFLAKVPLESVWADGHMTFSFGLATAAAEAT